MKIKHTRSNKYANAAIEIMMANMEIQEEANVGSFWYDPVNDELFGVHSVPVSSLQFYESKQFQANVKTGPKLHQTIWKKESMRGKDIRFKEDYTKAPRGRVFEFENIGFVVFTGDWINDYPNAKDLIISEFDLPKNTEFRIDEHWNVGRGWSNEF